MLLYWPYLGHFLPDSHYWCSFRKLLNEAYYTCPSNFHIFFHKRPKIDGSVRVKLSRVCFSGTPYIASCQYWNLELKTVSLLTGSETALLWQNIKDDTYVMASHTSYPSNGLVPSNVPPAILDTIVGNQSLTCTKALLVVPWTSAGNKGLWIKPTPWTPPSQWVAFAPRSGQLLAPVLERAPPLSKEVKSQNKIICLKLEMRKRFYKNMESFLFPCWHAEQSTYESILIVVEFNIIQAYYSTFGYLPCL